MVLATLQIGEQDRGFLIEMNRIIGDAGVGKQAREFRPDRVMAPAIFRGASGVEVHLEGVALGHGSISPTLESAKALFEGMFFDARKYDFSRVGRFKFNIKLDLDSPVTQKTMSAEDFFVVINYLLRLRKDVGRVDDIDNLGNRRVRAVGELLENQFRIGLVRMERAIKEKMSVHQDIDSAMPHDLINSKPVIAAIKEFFGSSQLSQFMDQTNPLSEVTHKRRLSALGTGRSLPRARRIRSPRRSPDALRPHLPDRDA